MSTIDGTVAADAWHSDFFGTVNEMPPEPVDLIATVLEAMGTEPGFQLARRTLIGDLGLGPGGSVAEAGCGTGAALHDLVSVVGSVGTVVGVDPSRPFVERARDRAAKAGVNATYQEGDARQLPLADATYDAAFCDKILIHVAPASRVIGEMARVTRPGGKVGALEWMPRFAISTTDPDLADRYNDIYRKAVCNYYVCADLERHFHAAGLVDVVARTHVAHTTTLDAHPFWRLFLLDQIPLFAHAGLITEEDGRRFAADQEELNEKGEFSAAFIIRTAVGTRRA